MIEFAIIERVIPGFEDYNVRVRGGGFTYPTKRGKGNATATGKANFTIHEIPDHQLTSSW